MRLTAQPMTASALTSPKCRDTPSPLPRSHPARSAQGRTRPHPPSTSPRPRNHLRLPTPLRQSHRRPEAALNLAGGCHRTYQQALNATRRQPNQAFFEKVYPYDQAIGKVQPAEPFDQLISRTYRRSNPEKRKNPKLLHAAQGSNVDLLAEGVGFEPTEPVNPAQQFSRLSPSSARPSLHGPD